MTPRPATQMETGELPLFRRRAPVSVVREIVTGRNVAWLIATLTGRDWTTAAELCAELGWVPAGGRASENDKRKIRALADGSGGKVIGGQRGYKLVRAMTGEEYRWWRNETLKMCDALRARVIETDQVFYGRAAVE